MAHSLQKPMRNNKIFTLRWGIVVTVMIILAIVIAIYNIQHTNIPKSGETVTLYGKIECLPHKGEGPHTLECALGLHTDTGYYYALLEATADLSVPDTRKRVKVEGKTLPIDKVWQAYDIKGSIRYTKIEEIN